MKASESQLVAAFLSALRDRGREIGAPDLAVEPAPRTPGGPGFGALVAGSPICIAIEFKRDGAAVLAEPSEWEPAARELFREGPRLVAHSIQCHLLVFGDPGAGPIPLRQAMYVEAALGFDLAELRFTDVAELIRVLYTDSDWGLEGSDVDEYLKAIAHLRDRADDSPWLAFWADADGRRHARTASSLAELLGEAPRARARSAGN